MRFPDHTMRKPTTTNFYTTKQIFDACNGCRDEPIYPYEEICTPYGPVCELTGTGGTKLVFLSEHNATLLDNWYRVEVEGAELGYDGRLDLGSQPHGPIEQVFHWFNMVDAEPSIGKVGVNVWSWSIIPPEIVEISEAGRIIKIPISNPWVTVSLEDAFYFENEVDAVAWRMQW